MTHRSTRWFGVLGVCAALLCSVGLLHWATDGLAVLTTDAARARRVRQSPVTVPAVLTRNHEGAVHAVLHDAEVAARGASDATPHSPRVSIVDFVYTRCLAVCGVLGGTYQRLQQLILERGLQDRVRLLTVSFDVARDDPASLVLYGRMQQADTDVWSLVTPIDTVGRDQLLQTFGIRVVPDGKGGWVHNAALHVVDPAGRLVGIVAIDDLEGALALALQAGEAAR